MLRSIVFLLAPTLLFADPGEDLLTAARKGDLAAVKSLTANGAPIEAKSPYGQTPLYVAAMNGHEPVVQFLLEKGASPDVTDTFYKAPMLAFVIQRKHYGVAKLLIAKSTGSLDEALKGIAQSGQADLVQAVLDKGKPSQSALDKAYETALEMKSTQLAELLKKAGAAEPAPAVTVDVKILESYVGTFKSEKLPLEIKAVVKDGALFMQATGQGQFPLKAKSPTLFEFTQAGLVVEFQSATAFLLKQGGMIFPFTKVVTQ